MSIITIACKSCGQESPKVRPPHKPYCPDCKAQRRTAQEKRAIAIREAYAPQVLEQKRRDEALRYEERLRKESEAAAEAERRALPFYDDATELAYLIKQHQTDRKYGHHIKFRKHAGIYEYYFSETIRGTDSKTYEEYVDGRQSHL